MRDVVLVGCTKRKQEVPSPARKLYQVSPLFRKRLRYAESLEPDFMLVLSAKHHVLGMDEVIEPYDEVLNEMSPEERRAWASKVLDQLQEMVAPERDRFVILAGRTYYQGLLPHLSHYEVPTGGMPIGETMRFLSNTVDRIG